MPEVNIKKELEKLDRNNFEQVDEFVSKIIDDIKEIIYMDHDMGMALIEDYMIDLINPNLLDFNSNKNWLERLGDIQQNESVDGNDIVREVDLHKFKILWSFENNSQAREAFKQWNEQYDDHYNNPENYKS